MRILGMLKADASSEAGAPPSKDLLERMGVFIEEVTKAGVLLDSNGLHPSRKGQRVRLQDGKITVIDGPFAETKELIAGYWIIQVRDRAEAIEWIKRCPKPHDGDCEIEIRQMFELEDFGESAAVEHHRKLGEEMAKQK